MTAISGVAPQPLSNSLLITSPEEHVGLIAKAIADKSIPIFEFAHQIAEYAHNESLTNWYKALSLLGQLPQQIPPPPLAAGQLCDGVWPIRGSFYLLPRGTFREFAELAYAYGQEHLEAFGNKNPFQFRGPEDWPHVTIDIKCKQEEWIWMSDDILEKSRGQLYIEHEEMLEELGADFEIPSFGHVARCLFLRKIATGESLLQYIYEHSKGTYTRVQEYNHTPLAVGNSIPEGVNLLTPPYCADFTIGVVALRRFKSGAI